MMQSLISILIPVSGFLWLFVALWLAPSVYHLFWGEPRRYDLMRAMFFFMGVLMFGYTLRWLLYPRVIVEMSNSELVMWNGLYSLSCILAFFVARTAGAYGRGERV